MLTKQRFQRNAVNTPWQKLTSSSAVTEDCKIYSHVCLESWYLMVDECIWVVIRALAGDHGIQFVHHGQQQLQLVSRLLQVDEHKLAQHCLSNLHSSSNSSVMQQTRQTRRDSTIAAGGEWINRHTLVKQLGCGPSAVSHCS